MIIKINNIDFRGSLIDGPGLRTVVYMQGCNIMCDECHNEKTFPIEGGEAIDVLELISILVKNINNKKITLSGGEPTLQMNALYEMLEILVTYKFNICLYTGCEYNEIPIKLLHYLNYIKVGPFKKELKCLDQAYIGSTNQRFIKLN